MHNIPVQVVAETLRPPSLAWLWHLMWGILLDLEVPSALEEERALPTELHRTMDESSLHTLRGVG